jgi:hypothetical protein
MLVIDVNSGTFREGEDDEDTAFRLNILACKEVARQVQMRDVGGIIMIDFVDMRRISNRNKVEKELEKAFKGDKARLNVMSIGALGVLQMSRQRTKDSLRGSLYSTCSHCDGTGLVPSKTHSAMGILREIRGNLRRFNGSQLKIATTAEMATEMFNLYKSEMVKMEEEENCQILLEIDNLLGHGEFKLLSKGGSHSNPHSNSHSQRPQAFISQKPREPHVQKSEGSADSALEQERRNKKKRKRNKQREDQHAGGDKPTDEEKLARLNRLDKEVPGESLGIIRAPETKVEVEKEKSVHAEVSKGSPEQKLENANVAPTPKAETQASGSSDRKSTEKTSPENGPHEAKSGAEKSKEDRSDKISSAQRRSLRNSPSKFKHKNKTKKSSGNDLNNGESNHNPPPTSVIE